ncbi:MAG TPA: SigE family RNA polymerase sigma factor [Streptosporangiaceae bacterium]
MTGTRAQSYASADDAIEDLYRAHALGLVRFALLLVGDKTTAEDVVQDAFLGLQQRWHRLAHHGNMLGYLRTAVLNGSRSVQRGRARTGRFRVPPDPTVWSAEAAAIAGESRRAILGAVARLPRRQREVLALKYYLGLSELEIAGVLQVSRGTVSSTASRALTALARELKEEQ